MRNRKPNCIPEKYLYWHSRDPFAQLRTYYFSILLALYKHVNIDIIMKYRMAECVPLVRKGAECWQNNYVVL